MNIFYRWISGLQFRFRKYAITYLMRYVIVGMAMVFAADLLLGTTTGFSLSAAFAFIRERVLAGQVWRLFTFIFIPPQTSIFFVFFTLYFYYLIGSSLEREWGSFWFNVYYLFGILGTVIAGFITGSATSYYLNMSLFFAFAVIFPNFEVLIFFILPVKIKWLAMLDAALFVWSFIIGSWAVRASILAALLNFFLFFGPSFLKSIREAIRVQRRRDQFTRQYRQGQDDNRWR